MNGTVTSGKGRALAITAIVLLAAVIALQIAILVQRRQDSARVLYPSRPAAPSLADRLRAWVSPRHSHAPAAVPAPRWDRADDIEQMQAQINRLFETAFQEALPQPPTTPAAASNSTTSGGSAFLFPVQHMQRMQRQIDAMFASAMQDVHALGAGFDDGWNTVDVTPSMTVEESPTNYEVRIHLPGVDRSALRVSMDGSLLTIQAEYGNSASGEKGLRVTNVTWQAHRAGRFERRLRLPHATSDHESINAVYKDSVLLITVPKEQAPELTRDRIKVI